MGLKHMDMENNFWNKIPFLSCTSCYNKNKVEKILKGSLDLIPLPSPSMKIQIMDGKVCLRCKGKTTFENKKFEITQQCLALIPQVNFPTNNLNFHWRWRWWDQIQAMSTNFLFSKVCRQCLAMFCLYTSSKLSRP